MTPVFLFQQSDSLLGEEWLASAVGIAITFIVFIMGVPALIFQTFIPDALRNVYNERLGKDWSNIFKRQIGLLFLLYILSNANFYKLFPENRFFEILEALVVLGLLFYVLREGYRHLIQNYYSTRNVEQRLSQKIVDDAILFFNEHRRLSKKDLDDLGILAREFRMGRTKNLFLEECERLVEYLLNVEERNADNTLIGEILNKTVCLSVTYDGAQFNNENMLKALDILMLTHSRIHHRNGDSDENDTYLNTIIGNCMKEIGIVAMRKNDLAAVMDTIEKLSPIESTSKEMFDLGNNALQHGYVQAAVTVVRKLDGKVRESLTPGQPLAYDDKRVCFSWLGLVAKIDQLDGTAREFAQRRLNPVVHSFGERRAELLSLFKDTQKYFYQLADFATVDAVRGLEIRVIKGH